MLQSFLRAVRTAATESPQLKKIVDELECVEKGCSEALRAEGILARLHEAVYY